MQRLTLFLFLLSFFLIKIPPFYVFYPLPYSFLTTHTLARGLVLLLLLVFIKDAFVKNRPLVKDNDRPLFVLFLLFFLFQSVSIFGAMNIVSFLQRYKDIVFPGIFLLAAFKFRNKQQAFINVFFVSLIFNFFYQALMFFLPNLFREVANIFVYKDHFDLVNINLQRGRIFIETYDEIAIPFLFFSLSGTKSRLAKTGLLLLFIIVALPSLLSNFRSRILMLAFAFVASLFLLSKKNFLAKINLFSLLLICSYLAYVLLNNFLGFSFIDRFTLADKKEDVKTIESRTKNLATAVDMTLANPLSGVGLGNYYDNLSLDKKIRISLFNWKNKESEIASTNPHDIFAQIMAETGLISLLFYLFMMIFFFINDFKSVAAGNKLKTSFIIAFWTLFLYSLFNPTTTLTYNLLFWTLRVFV